MQICIMNWKTFLSLFKEDYSLFYYDGINWGFKMTDIKIQLYLSNKTISDNKIIFFDKGAFKFNEIL